MINHSDADNICPVYYNTDSGPATSHLGCVVKYCHSAAFTMCPFKYLQMFGLSLVKMLMNKETKHFNYIPVALVGFSRNLTPDKKRLGSTSINLFRQSSSLLLSQSSSSSSSVIQLYNCFDAQRTKADISSRLVHRRATGSPRCKMRHPSDLAQSRFEPRCCESVANRATSDAMETPAIVSTGKIAQNWMATHRN